MSQGTFQNLHTIQNIYVSKHIQYTSLKFAYCTRTYVLRYVQHTRLDFTYFTRHLCLKSQNKYDSGHDSKFTYDIKYCCLKTHLVYEFSNSNTVQEIYVSKDVQHTHLNFTYFTRNLSFFVLIFTDRAR